MPLQNNGPAPYAPAATVITVIERSRGGNLITPVDAGVLGRIGVPESLGPRTLAGLKHLELILEDGQISPYLEAMKRAHEDKFKETVEQWLRSVYAEVFGLLPDPGAAKLADVEHAMRGYKPEGQHARMVTLFVGLMDYAGLLPEDSPLKASTRSTNRAAAKPRPRRQKPSPATSVGEPDIPESPPQHAAFARPMSKGELVIGLDRPGLHPFIEGLVQTLPAVGTPWSQAKRDAWLKAADAAFAVIYELPDDSGGVTP